MEHETKELAARPDALAPEFEQMRVADALTAGVISCPLATSLSTVASLMATHVVHAVFVFDYGDEADEDVELWGVVTDLDLAAAAAEGSVTSTAQQRAVTPLVTVQTDESLKHAAALMAEHRVSHLAVLDVETGRPAGVLSTLDIARAIAGLERPRGPGRVQVPV